MKYILSLMAIALGLQMNAQRLMQEQAIIDAKPPAIVEEVVQGDIADAVLTLQGVKGINSVQGTVNGATGRVVIAKAYSMTSYCDVRLQVKEGRYKITLSNFFFTSNGYTIPYGGYILLSGRRAHLDAFKRQKEWQQFAMLAIKEACAQENTIESDW